MNKFVLTGFEKSTGKMNTQLRDNIEKHLSRYDVFCPEAVQKRYKSASSLEFDVKSRRSHNGAVIISDEKYSWSIFLIK